MDLQVDSLFVRDLDSEISKREAEVVEQFSKSSKVSSNLQLQSEFRIIDISLPSLYSID